MGQFETSYDNPKIPEIHNPSSIKCKFQSLSQVKQSVYRIGYQGNSILIANSQALVSIYYLDLKTNPIIAKVYKNI